MAIWTWRAGCTGWRHLHDAANKLVAAQARGEHCLEASCPPTACEVLGVRCELPGVTSFHCGTRKIGMRSAACDVLSDVQNIQELTPGLAQRHELVLREWPVSKEACTAQQLSRLSLHGEAESRPGGASEEVAPAAVQHSDGMAGSQSPASHTAVQRKSGDSSSSGVTHSRKGVLLPDGATASTSACCSVSGPPTSAGKAALRHQSVPKSREAQQQEARNRLVLSRDASIPGQSWQPCPQVNTPDASQSDYITVLVSPSPSP